MLRRWWRNVRAALRWVWRRKSKDWSCKVVWKPAAQPSGQRRRSSSCGLNAASTAGGAGYGGANGTNANSAVLNASFGGVKARTATKRSGAASSIRLATFNAAHFASQPPTHHRQNRRGKAPLHESPPSSSRRRRTTLDVLLESDADLVALQAIHANPADGMKPLSHLASSLRMHYAFAESWAPEYGNAVLSRWPIKSSHVQQLVDDSDWRNVLHVVVDVPSSGDLHLCCTHLDHLDEDWRLRQATYLANAFRDVPHILAGNLNALDASDYSTDRWSDVAKLQTANGKLPPRGDVMNFLKEQGYRDCKDYAGDSDSVVLLPPGQGVQGTCKYGTRVDYIMASPRLEYRFVPESYTIVSSRGTSDHHLVRVDIEPTSPRREIT